MKGVIAGCALLLAALAACTSPAGPPTGAQATAPPSVPAPARDVASPSGTAAVGEGATGKEGPSGSTEHRARGGGSNPNVESLNTMPLNVRLSAPCVRPGEMISADIRTRANATIGMTAYYYGTKNEQAPDMNFVPSDANVSGRYVWRWVVRPDIPPGGAELSVVVAEGEDGAVRKVPFRVATSC